MISINAITQWRQYAPWMHQFQVEQDLILSRALVMLFQHPVLQSSLAFRGGTALNKLYCKTAARYSEDLDFVQVRDEPIGEVMSAIREVLDPWLGEARYKQGSQMVRLIYRFTSEDQPAVPLRLKIEINAAESFTVFGYKGIDYAMENRWFTGRVNIRTFCLEELMATKFCALYQRSKGRDLYDLWLAIKKLKVDCEKIIDAFHHYTKARGVTISRAEYEKNLSLKSTSTDFLSDAAKVLPSYSQWTIDEAFSIVMERLVNVLPGKP